MSKVYITNITSDVLNTDGRTEISNLKLRKLICDRQIENGALEKQVVSILDCEEYQSVLSNGYYVAND